MDLKKKIWNIKFTDYAQKWLENKKALSNNAHRTDILTPLKSTLFHILKN